MSLPKAVIDQLLREMDRRQRHRHDSREGCRSINTDMQITSRVRVLPPFKVVSRALVRNLNAELLQGRTVAEILADFSSGISSLGKYGDSGFLVGAVKLEEGSEITLTRSDPHNSIIIAGSIHDAVKIKGKTVDDSAIGDNKVLTYNAAGDKIIYQAAGGGAATHSEIFLAFGCREVAYT